MHRFVWDLHEPEPEGVTFGYPIAAVAANTPVEPAGPWVVPGRYTVRLTAAGRTVTQPLVVRMDPRVRLTAAELARQHTLSRQLVAALRDGSAALRDLRALRAKVRDARTAAGPGAAADALADFDRRAAAIEAGAGPAATLTRVNGELAALYGTAQDADVPPTSQLLAAISGRLLAGAEVLRRYRSLVGTELPALNARLRAAGAAEIR